MDRNTIIEEIIDYFNENEEVFNEAIEELNSYNGCLGYERWMTIDELNDALMDIEPSSILFKAFFGYDAESWSLDSSGNKIYRQFNPNRDFFRFNAYDNLVSCDYKDYSSFNGSDTIESMLEHYYNGISAIRNNIELWELFDKLDECEE